MIQRKIAEYIRRVAGEYAVVSVMGPRQSGKTTLVKSLFPQHGYVNLEDPDERLAAESDGAAFMKRHPAPLIIDEVQRVPGLLSRIQVLADDTPARKGAYVIIGSHQPALRAAVSQSLAGRVAIATLMPLTLSELAAVGIRPPREEILFKGFMPRIHGEGATPSTLYSNYLATYVERDVNEILNLRNRRTFESFLRLVAGRTGQLMNYDALSSEIGVSAATIKSWLSVLEASFITFTLPCYYRNWGKRFVRTPKVYFTEVGLAAHLLGIRSPDQIVRDPLFGGLFENMVIADILKSRLNRGLAPDLYFIRDHRGLEADLAIENGRRLDLYEIKSSMSFSPDFASGLRKLQTMIPDIRRSTVVYSGQAHSVSGIDYVNFCDVAEIA